MNLEIKSTLGPWTSFRPGPTWLFSKDCLPHCLPAAATPPKSIRKYLFLTLINLCNKIIKEVLFCSLQLLQRTELTFEFDLVFVDLLAGGVLAPPFQHWSGHSQLPTPSTHGKKVIIVTLAVAGSLSTHYFLSPLFSRISPLSLSFLGCFSSYTLLCSPNITAKWLHTVRILILQRLYINY